MLTDDATIRVDRLTKRFGAVHAVDDLSFEVRPGAVTGFLGPNGAGKTTTMRMLLGLVRPTAGTATIGGRAYRDIPDPLRAVGAALDASFHPGRTALDHLRVYAPAAGASEARCRMLLDVVGLADVAGRRAGGFSLGMRQRLALATTLLGDPRVLVLDEPANGLDPEGIVWLRGFLRHLAGEGRTVMVSSHVLSEVQQSVDDVVVISQGRLAHASSLADLARLTSSRTRVTGPDLAALAALARARGWQASTEGTSLVVHEVTAAEVGGAAFAAGVELHGLTEERSGLEEVFLRLVTPTPATAQPLGGAA